MDTLFFFLNSKKGHFSCCLFTNLKEQYKRRVNTPLQQLYAFSQISSEKKMFELGAIIAPFWQAKEGKYYLDEVQAKLFQHTLFHLRLKAYQKKFHPATVCEVCHLLRKAQHSNTRKDKVKKKFNCAEAIRCYTRICSHRLFIKPLYIFQRTK